jgi:hypothetical protein
LAAFVWTNSAQKKRARLLHTRGHAVVDRHYRLTIRPQRSAARFGPCWSRSIPAAGPPALRRHRRGRQHARPHQVQPLHTRSPKGPRTQPALAKSRRASVGSARHLQSRQCDGSYCWTRLHKYGLAVTACAPRVFAVLRAATWCGRMCRRVPVRDFIQRADGYDFAGSGLLPDRFLLSPSGDRRQRRF